MNKSTISALFGAAFIFTLLLIPFHAQAQTVLELKRVVNVAPDIELYFQVNSSGQLTYINDENDYSIEDNGMKVESFSLWCPNPATRYPISVAMALDASGSMSGSGNAGAKAAANAFVSMMDSTSDEAAVLWFNSMVNVQLGMTSNIQHLHTAIDALPAMGATAVWDAIYQALQEVHTSAANSHRAVIALTDGNDNTSTRTPTEIIAYAIQNHIRVYTIGLGSVSPIQLQNVSTATGGIYYNAPTPAQLTTVFQQISSLASKGFEECMIYYENECKDGAVHTVELAVDNGGAGSDVKLRSYRAELDTTTVDRMYISMGDHITVKGEESTIPVRYYAPYPVTIGPGEFTVGYSTDLVESATINKNGTALENISTIITPMESGFLVKIDEPVTLNGSGNLIAMDVKTMSDAPISTATLPVGGWVSESPQCLYVGTEDGAIMATTTDIGAYAPSLVRSIDISPNPNNGVFVVSLDFPQPTAFTLRIVNVFGEVVYARNVSGSRISYQESISLKDAPPGMYFLTTQSSNRYDFQKFIVR